MKKINDCVRDLLFEITNIPYGEVISVSELQKKVNKYSLECVIYALTLLNRERYIIVISRPGYDDNDLFADNRIKDLTERGYRNFDLIRDDKIWNLMKEKISNFDELSIFTIFGIANKLVNCEQNKSFNLPDNYYVDFSRW